MKTFEVTGTKTISKFIVAETREEAEVRFEILNPGFKAKKKCDGKCGDVACTEFGCIEEKMNFVE